MPPGWLPRMVDGSPPKMPANWVPPSRHGPQPIHYSMFSDMQMAAALNFYQTTNIVVHESKIELLELIKALSDDSKAEHFDQLIALEVQAVVALSNAIMATFPGFLLAAKLAGGRTPERSKNRADNAGRFFAMFSMPVFLKSEHVPEEHKFVARWLIDSIRVDYALADCQ